MNQEEWTWEASPKRQFNLKRLQRCYDMEYNNPIQPPKPEKQPRDTKNMRKERSQPYWNMWRAVLTGWLIRYPMVFFKMIGITVLGSFFLTLLLIGSISNTLDDSQSIPEEVQRDL
jgi:hypothetical protein